MIKSLYKDFYTLETCNSSGMIKTMKNLDISLNGCNLPERAISSNLYVDVPARPNKFSVPILKEKHLILLKLCAFLQFFAQNTIIFCNLGSFVSDENPPIQ